MLYQWTKDLFPICRSITGNGVRETLSYIKNILPELEIYQVPSGTKAFDWKIPKEWNIKDAYIKNSKGEKIVDFKENNLHIVGYSVPINKKINLSELLEHLHSLPDQPEAIPYITSYYKEYWGFCVKDNFKKSLKEDTYHVVVDSSLSDGFLNYGELIIPGSSKKEIFISTYICHPSLANNELSGPVLTTGLASWISSNKNNFYTYRIIFIPETIGSIVYLSRNLSSLKKNVIAGYNITCVGDDGDFSYMPSRKGDTPADKVAQYVLEISGRKFKKYSFLDRGSDERQYCSPGVDLPVCSVMRSKYGTYSEYHTSLDNLDFISEKSLQESLDIYKKIIRTLEINHIYHNEIFCEPQLGKRGLYPNLSKKGNKYKIKPLTNILAYADGENDLIDLSKILKENIENIHDNCQLLESKNLLKKKNYLNQIKDFHEKKDFIAFAENLTDSLVDGLYDLNLNIHTTNNLSKKEVGFLYRWVFYVAVNTFILRLIRVKNELNQKILKKYHINNHKFKHQKNSNKSCFYFYHSYDLNADILNKILSLLDDNKVETEIVPLNNYDQQLHSSNNLGQFKRKYNFSSATRFLKRVFFNNPIAINIKKPNIVHERSKWMDQIFSPYGMFVELEDKDLKLNKSLRLKIRKSLKEIIKQQFSTNSFFLSLPNLDKMSDLFSDWIDKITPLSLIEDFQRRFDYYELLSYKWNPKQIHNCTGTFDNDNLKIFSLLCKRNGTILVGHEHGANNFIKVFDENGDPSSPKRSNQLLYEDFYLTWSKKGNTMWNYSEKKLDVKLIHAGSVYLDKLQKAKLNGHLKNPNEKIKILYLPSAMKLFNTNLAERNSEFIKNHRLKVLKFLKIILNKYDNIEIIYKPFPLTFPWDPIKEYLQDEFQKNKITIINTHPIKYMKNVNCVLMDMVSTAFAEVSHIEVPFLVFDDKYDYSRASDEGKKFNDILYKNNLLFYDLEAGIEIFDKFMENPHKLNQKIQSEMFNYKNLIASNTSKKNILKTIVNLSI
tara:strand:- start:39463 stop:42477 length:3015 start_codon:yes stop_codon:yes gene_type:complete